MILYAHNCLYDIKPFLISFVERYGNNQILTQTYIRKEFNKFTGETERVKAQTLKQPKARPLQYKLIMKELKHLSLYS